MTAELSRKANQCAGGAETAVRPSIPPPRRPSIPTIPSKGEGGRDEEVETWCSKRIVPASQLIGPAVSSRKTESAGGDVDILLVRGDTCLSVCDAKEAKDDRPN